MGDLSKFNTRRIEKMADVSGKQRIILPCTSSASTKDGSVVLWNQRAIMVNDHIYATNYTNNNLIIRDGMSDGMYRNVGGRKHNIRVAACRTVRKGPDRFRVTKMSCGDMDCINPRHADRSEWIISAHKLSKCLNGCKIRSVAIKTKDGKTLCPSCHRRESVT
jgi:hypothetical protein